MQQLLTLLQINDSMFPIGGFTHSYGLETYISLGLVKDVESATRYAETMLRHSIYYNDAALLGRAWEIDPGRKAWKQLEALDQLATALKSPYEIREASRKLAIRFLKLTLELQSFPLCQKYLDAIQKGTLQGHYALAFGLYCRLVGIEQPSALKAFYYNTLNGIVTNCAKMVPISQTHAQKILYNLKNTIEELAGQYQDLKEEDIGLCCIGQDIRCMQHEKLYTRIYIS